MDAILEILASLSFLGIPLIVVAVLAIIGGVVLNFIQKRVEAETDEDDPDDDPAVRRVSGFRKLALWGGFILGILGAVFLSAPEWATIF
jgi:hypothetical protein